jgi:hypothetical protein
MCRLADRGVVHVEIRADCANDHLARVQAYADADSHAMLPPHGFGVLLDHLLHPQRRVARPYGVIFVG